MSHTTENRKQKMSKARKSFR